MNIRQLTQEYLQFAANETDKKGNKRAATTMTSYRRALEGFAAAVEQSGLDLTELPESFIEKNWLATQQSVVNQTIQLRVRAAAVKQFTSWLFRNNIPCAPMRNLTIQTPPPKPKSTKENTMSDVTSLGDAMLQADPVPSTQSQPQYMAYEQPAPAPQKVAPPPPPRQQKAPVGPGRPANPLASMLPTGQYKMRVRREREIDDPVWLGDFPAERVAAAGAIEPFLGREVVPKLLAQGITGDVTFLVSALAPDGREGERARITVAAVPQAPVQAIPAPVAGVAAAAPVAIPTGMQPNEMADMMSYHRRAQEELEERIAKKLEAQQAANNKAEAARPVVTEASKNNGELDDLKRLVGQLAGTVQNLAARLEDREMDRMDRMDRLEAIPQQPAVPQLDILSVIREVTAMTKAQQAPAAPTQAMGLGEVFSVMAQAKQMFQPAQVNIDVSPLEEQIADLRHQLASSSKKKDEIGEMVEKFKAMKELFGLVGGETSASKPTTGGLSNALGNLVTKVLDNPAPLAEAVERILTATAQVKAAQTGAPPPPQRVVQPAAPQLPPQLKVATEALLAAESEEATVVAAHEWLTTLLQVPQLQKAGARITQLIKDDKVVELAIMMRQVFNHLGVADKASVDRCKAIAAAIMAQVKAVNGAAEDEEEESDDGEADLTVRVGGVRAAAQDDEEAEYEDEDSEDDSDDEEDESDEYEDESEDESDEEEQLDAHAISQDELAEVLASAEPQVVEEKPRRKRRTKAEMAAARAADEASEPVAVTVVDAPVPPPESVVS